MVSFFKTHIAPILDNPLLLKGVRSRLRPKQMLVWGSVTVVLTCFIVLIAYAKSIHNGKTGFEDAAKAAFASVFVFQALILYLFGTSHVTLGISKDKTSGVIDYHRITPMPTIQKLTGYIIGLASLEYFMFALTLPFALSIAILGNISLFQVTYLYLIFFCSAWLYHATGFAFGMMHRKNKGVRGLVFFFLVALFIATPELSRLGFSFLGVLSIIPAYYSIMGELSIFQHQNQSLVFSGNVESWHSIPFFYTELDTTIFTLLVQGLLLFLFLFLAHRKFENQEQNALSKPVGIVSFLIFQLLLSGSIWPLLVNPKLAKKYKLISRFAYMEPQNQFFWLLFIFSLLTLSIAAILLIGFTPLRKTNSQRMKKPKSIENKRTSMLSGSISSDLIALGFAFVMCMSYLFLWWQASASPVFFKKFPSLSSVLSLPLVLVGLLFLIQKAKGFFSTGAFVVFLFCFWFVPILAVIAYVLYGSTPLQASFLAISNPLVVMYHSNMAAIHENTSFTGEEWIRNNSLFFAYTGFFIQVIAVVLISILQRGKKSQRNNPMHLEMP